MEGKKGSGMYRWVAITVVEPGKPNDVFPLDNKQRNIRKFKRATRRSFPKDINSTVPKDMIIKAFKELDKQKNSGTDQSNPLSSFLHQKPKPIQQTQPKPNPPEIEINLQPQEFENTDLESALNSFSSQDVTLLGEGFFPSLIGPKGDEYSINYDDIANDFCI